MPTEELNIKVSVKGAKEGSTSLDKLADAAAKAEGRILAAQNKINTALSKMTTGQLFSGTINQITKAYADLQRKLATIDASGLGELGKKQLQQLKSSLGQIPSYLSNIMREIDKGVKNNTLNIGRAAIGITKMQESLASASKLPVGGLSVRRLKEFRSVGDSLLREIAIRKEHNKLIGEEAKDREKEAKAREKEIALQEKVAAKAAEQRAAIFGRVAWSKQINDPIEQVKDKEALANQGTIGQRLKIEKTIADQLRNQNTTLSKISSTKGQIRNITQSISSSTSNWVKGIAKGLGLYLSLYGAGLLLRRTFESWVGLIKEALEQIDDLRTQIYSSAAMMTSLSETAAPTKQVYDDWKEYFDWLYRASLAADRKVASSGKEIFKVAQEVSYRGVVPVTTEQVETLGRLTDTIKLVTRGIGHQEWQIYQEIRNLFLGSEARLMGAQLLQRFKQIDPEVQKNIASLQRLRDETGDIAPMFEYIQYLLKGMNIASEDLARTWGSLVSTTEGAWQVLMVDAFGEAYDEIVKVGWQLLDIIYKNGKLTAAGKLLSHTLSSAWSIVSKTIKEFADELESDPKKIAIWVDTFISGITRITQAFMILGRIVLFIAEKIQAIIDNLERSQEIIERMHGTYIDIGADKTGESRGMFQRWIDDLNKFEKQLQEEGQFGDYKGRTYPTKPMPIKEEDMLGVLEKIQNAYLEFSKIATRSEESVWSKVLDFQMSSLERIKDIRNEYEKITGITKNAIGYEKQLLDIRQKAINAMIEGIKLEYQEYLVGMVDTMENERKKLEIEQEKARKKWELPPQIKMINVYADRIDQILMNSGKNAGKEILDGCTGGGDRLIEAAKTVKDILESIGQPKTTFKPENSQWGYGGYIDTTFSNYIYESTKKARELGIGYGYGSRSSMSGSIDCSGWVCEKLKDFGSTLNTSADGLAKFAERQGTLNRNMEYAKPGSVLFRESGGGKFGHTGFLIEQNGEMVVSHSASGIGPTLSKYNKNYWQAFAPVSTYTGGSIGAPERAMSQAEINKKIEEDYLKLQKEVQGIRNLQLEKENEITQNVNLQLTQMIKKLEIDKQALEQRAQAYEGTEKEFSLKNQILDVENRISYLNYLKGIYTDKELKSLYENERISQLELDIRKREDAQREESIKAIEKINTFTSKNIELLTDISNINTEYLGNDSIIILNEMKKNKLLAEQYQQRRELNKFILENSNKLTEEEKAILIANQRLKERVDIYNQLVESEKSKLAEGGIVEGMQLWALERIPEMKTRTSQMIADVAREMENTLGNAVMNVIKNRGTEGLRELGQQLTETILERIIQMAITRMFDWVATMLGVTTSLQAASVAAASSLTAGGAAAATAMINGALTAKMILAGSGEGGFTPISAIGGGGGETTGGLFGLIKSGFGFVKKIFGFAEGGIIPGGFIPIHAFAEGGVTKSPILGMIGEAGPEAVIPLQNGSIPVKMEKGKEETQTTIINVLDPSLIGKVAAEVMSSNIGKRIIINTINQDVYERGSTQKVIRGVR